MLTADLLDGLFGDQRPAAGTRLIVASGYASSAFVYYLLEEREAEPFAIDLRIGMAPIGGVPVWDHQEYRRLMSGRFRCRYRRSLPADHRKVYGWANDQGRILAGFIGSANFSWAGFRDLREILTETSPSNAESLLCVDDTEYIGCDDERVADVIPFAYRESNTMRVDSRSLSRELVGKPFVDLSLLTAHGRMPTRSGINWGQRSGRDHDQAYLSIPAAIRDAHSDFFPARAEEFTMITDDGQSFLCVIAQDDDKAIETKRDNAELGRYLRDRLGVDRGAFVDADDLKRYGRDSVRIYKLSGNAYFMDLRV